jgi:hypothetical protein
MPSPRQSPTFTSYVVKRRRVAAIARGFRVTIGAILAANPGIMGPDILTVSETILIPPPGWAPSPSPS